MGKRPLPDHWEKPLYDFLYPMLDPGNEIHQKHYQADKVVILEEQYLFSEYQDLNPKLIRRTHFQEKYYAGADVVYFRFININLQEACLSIYSAYRKGSW